jgi:hypothetical protein
MENKLLLLLLLLLLLIAGLQHAVSGLHCAGTVHAGTCKRTGTSLKNLNFLYGILKTKHCKMLDCLQVINPLDVMALTLCHTVTVIASSLLQVTYDLSDYNPILHTGFIFYSQTGRLTNSVWEGGLGSGGGATTRRVGVGGGGR